MAFLKQFHVHLGAWWGILFLVAVSEHLLITIKGLDITTRTLYQLRWGSLLLLIEEIKIIHQLQNDMAQAS